MKKLLLLILLLICSNAFAWELQNKTLEECIHEIPSIVVGQTIKVISEKESDFGGVGKEWKIRLKVQKVLKGQLDENEIVVHFSDVHMGVEGGFDRNQEYVWFLDRYDSSDDYWMRNFASVYSKKEESEITRIIQDQKSDQLFRTYKVKRVIDGDTIVVKTPEGTSEEVQLAGINAPEGIDPSIDVTLYFPSVEASDDMEQFNMSIDVLQRSGQEATEFVEKLLPKGTGLRLEYDNQKQNQYGQQFAYVYMHDPRALFDEKVHVIREEKIYLLINSVIILSGYARPLIVPSNRKYAELFQELYEDARENKRGLWKN